MLQRQLSLLTRLLWFVDSLNVLIAWVVAYYFRFHTHFIPPTKGIPPFARYFMLSFVILLIWSLVFIFRGMYRFKRTASFGKEFLDLIKANIVAILVFITFTYLFKEYKFSRLVLGIFWVLAVLFMAGTRLFLYKAIRRLRKKGFNQLRVLIVGSGSLARTTFRILSTHPEIGLQILGFIGEEKEKLPLPVFGKLLDIDVIVSKIKPDQLFIAVSPLEFAAIEPKLRNLSDCLVDICIIPDVQQFITLSCSVESFEGMPIVHINDVPLKDSWNRFLKRAFDMVVTLEILILSLPVQILISLFIKCTSRGPVFYMQERLGLDGAVFKMLKFRSMRVDAEAKTGAIWAKKEDNRTTFIGKWLRKFSLDELPQLINVLKGDMSLIGPRPERPVFVQEFSRHFPKYMLRHKVKAGMTGWAQVNGWRGNSSLEKRIECDLYYIKNWSLLFDLRILWLTLWRGIINKNAY